MTREEAAQGADGIRPGFYQTRLVRAGPLVGCRIVESEGLWACLVGGTLTCADARLIPWDVPRLLWVAYSHPISEAEYDAMLSAAAAAQPGEPLAKPTEPVDWRQAPSLY